MKLGSFPRAFLAQTILFLICHARLTSRVKRMHAGGADVTAGRSPLIKGDRPGVDGRVNLIEGKCNRARAFLVSVLDAAGVGAGVRGVGAGGHCRAMVLRRTTCGDPGAATAASDGPKLAGVHRLLQDPARTDSSFPRVNFCEYKIPLPLQFARDKSNRSGLSSRSRDNARYSHYSIILRHYSAASVHTCMLSE